MISYLTRNNINMSRNNDINEPNNNLLPYLSCFYWYGENDIVSFPYCNNYNSLLSNSSSSNSHEVVIIV